MKLSACWPIGHDLSQVIMNLYFNILMFVQIVMLISAVDEDQLCQHCGRGKFDQNTQTRIPFKKEVSGMLQVGGK